MAVNCLWTLRANDEDGRVGGDERDRRELIDGEGRRPAEELVGLGDDRDRRQRQQQRVAVRLAGGDVLHAHRARGAGLVHDADGALQHLLHRRGHRARGEVRHAAGRKRRHEADRAGGIRLVADRGSRRDDRHDRHQDESAKHGHQFSPFSASARRARQSSVFVTSGRSASSTSTAPTASSVAEIGRWTKIA